MNETRLKFRTFTLAREPGMVTPDLRVIRTGAEAAAYLHPFFAQADDGREHFGALFLDSRHRPIAGKILFSGGLNETPVFPREIVRQALLLNAAGVICAHTHPSGDLTPSREDEAVTRRIAAALASVEIRLLDHLVVNAAGDHRSVGSS